MKSIKDDVDYYVESSQEPDYPEDDCIYEDLDLEETIVVQGKMAGKCDAVARLACDIVAHIRASPVGIRPVPDESLLWASVTRNSLS